MRFSSLNLLRVEWKIGAWLVPATSGADPGFFWGGGALVSCSTSTPINHSFFLQNASCIRKPLVISGERGVRTPCTLPPDLPLLFVLCAVFHGATSMNNSQTLLLRFKTNIRSACTPANTWRYGDMSLVPIDGNRCSSRPPKCDYRLIIDWPIPIDANQQ